ncbi:HAD-IC family P-type ATPase [Rhizobium sp. LjRoot30]|uniref:HAD-IC family P-type ATPase n=1 Tax=Rhizobium sp. LjRoot30 TaxID=3342320 RepID=UPI003ED02788
MGQGTDSWHGKTANEALDALGVSAHGLNSLEAAVRFAQFGPNELPVTPGRPAWKRFVSQFHNVLIYFLLAAAVAASLLDHVIDASVIVAVVIVNAVVGFVQEGRAEQALNAIRDMIAPKAIVLREGARTIIAVRDIVPGDIVLLEAGDRVPADLRLLRARQFLVDEAILTGESMVAEKDEAPVAFEAVLGDRRNMAYSGTLVVSGQATGLAVHTGMATEIGRISRLIQDVEQLSTPLLRQIDAFAKRFTSVVAIGSVLLFAFAVLVRRFDWVDALISVVALAVGIVPEGLPTVITITLAIGVRRMAQRNAVIRKLPAVETLGATSVICTDKTGTLTLNEMTARRIDMRDTRLFVSG